MTIPPSMNADTVNGLFELCAALFILNHSRVLYADKQVRGASRLSTAFFFSWGLWNIYYYPGLDQWWSFAGGLAVVSANCLWLGLMLRYGRGTVAQPVSDSAASGSPSSYRARPSDPDLNPVSVKDLSASASPATKEQQ